MAQVLSNPATRPEVAVPTKDARMPASTITASVVVLAGIAVLAAVFVPRLFDRAPALEDLTDDLRPAMSDAGIEQLRADLEVLGEASEELDAKVVPAVAAALETSPAETAEFLGTQFPAVALGIETLPATVADFSALADLLDAEQGRFRATDDIPTATLPATTVPWAILVIGLAVVAAGGWLLATGTRRSAVATTVLGAVVVVVVTGLSLPSKASSADTLNSHVSDIFTESQVRASSEALAVVGAMSIELRDEALPALGQLLGVPADQLGAAIEVQFPALASALNSLPAMSERFTALVDTVDRNVARYEKVQTVPFARVIWTVLTAGFVALGAGSAALLAARSRRQLS